MIMSIFQEQGTSTLLKLLAWENGQQEFIANFQG